MSDEEALHILCMPTFVDGKRIVGVEDTRVSHCHTCGEDVLVAPSSRKMMADKPERTYIIQCVDCGMKELSKLPEDEKVRIETAPGAEEELRNAWEKRSKN